MKIWNISPPQKILQEGNIFALSLSTAHVKRRFSFIEIKWYLEEFDFKLVSH